jgi:hypothetical protein
MPKFRITKTITYEAVIEAKSREDAELREKASPNQMVGSTMKIEEVKEAVEAGHENR